MADAFLKLFKMATAAEAGFPLEASLGRRGRPCRPSPAARLRAAVDSGPALATVTAEAAIGKAQAGLGLTKRSTFCW